MSVWNLYIHMASFRRRTFSGECKDLWITSSWIRVGPNPTDKKGKQMQRRSWEDRGKGKHHVLKFPGPQKLEEGHGTLSIRASGRNRP